MTKNLFYYAWMITTGRVITEEYLLCSCQVDISYCLNDTHAVTLPLPLSVHGGVEYGGRLVGTEDMPTIGNSL